MLNARWADAIGWALETEPEVWRRYFAVVLDGLRPEGATQLPG